MKAFDLFCTVLILFQYFIENNIPYDPEYVFYDVRVSTFVAFVGHENISVLGCGP